MTPLPIARQVSLPQTDRPFLFVVVDTEEEFDWSRPTSRSNTDVTAMQHIGRAQRIFDRYALLPTYVIDYPVASKAQGYEPLQDIWGDRRCQIGAHLHPWVNPPYTEEVTGRHSFMMNLPRGLQHEKLDVLTRAIGERFSRPTVFKAGRYGLDGTTVRVLEALDYQVDTSVCPRMNFTDEGGPSFTNFGPAPFMLTNGLMELPCTVEYVGWAGRYGQMLHTFAQQKTLSRFRSVGVLARTHAVNRIMLSPEGNTLGEMVALTRSLFKAGCRSFALTFHSPSVVPGHTPYVRSQTQLDAFLRRLDDFCAFFMTELNGLPSTPQQLRDSFIHSTGTSA